jgi:transposase-like protein
MGKQVQYSSEVRERAVRLFQQQVHEHPSRWAAMQSIAGKIGCTTQTLSTWVSRAEAAADPRRNAALADRERVKTLEREVAELRRANEILRKASAFFAQAELDRRGK